MIDSKITATILSLASIDNIGPIKIKLILSQAERPEEILEWGDERFSSIPGIGPELAQRISRNLSAEYGQKMIEWAAEKKIDILTIADPDYPELLRDIYDPPPFLFVAGNLTDADRAAVAVVGSRMATDYGKNFSEKLGEDLAGNGITVVSGMAIGIDSASHRGALKSGGRTIAVLGSGIDVIYPPENKALYQQIAESGAVISEFMPGTRPEPMFFPRRNRVISGISQAVVVVEAGHKSGALLTADLALSQGRELFAVPGPVTSRMSLGTNDLIKSRAKPITSLEDIFSVLPRLKKDYIAPGKKVTDELSKGEILVFDHLSATPKQLDRLVRDCGLSVNDTTAYLLSLELRGLVKQLSGKRFMTI